MAQAASSGADQGEDGMVGCGGARQGVWPEIPLEITRGEDAHLREGEQSHIPQTAKAQ